MTFFPSRKKAWLPEFGMAQSRWMPQTSLGRANCHCEHLAGSFFKKHWVSIFDVHGISLPTNHSREPQGYVVCVNGSWQSHLSGTVVNREWPLLPAHSLDVLSPCKEQWVNRRLSSSALCKLQKSHVAQVTLKTRSFSLGIQSPLHRCACSGEVGQMEMSQHLWRDSKQGDLCRFPVLRCCCTLNLFPFLFLSQSDCS